MKNVKSQLLSRSFVLMISLFLLGLSTSYAQIGELGIYGSVPESKRANTRFVRIEPNDTEDPIGYTIPVNGLKNFNFYYLWTGLGFLPGQHYTITYLDASKSSLGYEIVNYTPNSGYTNGTQASTPFYTDSPYYRTPLGVYGRLYGQIGGINYPFPNARIILVPERQTVGAEVRTNGNGDFYAYYQNGNAQAFLPVDPSHGHETYDFMVFGTLNGCTFSTYVPQGAYWAVGNFSDPSHPSYFTFDAYTNVGNVVITGGQCGD